MTPDSREHQLPIDAVEEALDVEIKNPVEAPTAFAGLGHGIDGRFAGPVAVGVVVKDGLQNRLQKAPGDLLGDTVGHRRHRHIELH